MPAEKFNPAKLSKSYDPYPEEQPLNFTITIHRTGEGYWFVTSSDIPGLHLAGMNLVEILADLGPVIKDLLKNNKGLDI